MSDHRRRVEMGRILVDARRFAAGWRLVPGLELGTTPVVPPGAPLPQPSLVVDLVRARDLVAFTPEAYECDLLAGEAGPVLSPRPDTAATLMVRFPYQHLAERAIWLADGGGHGARDPRPRP